MPYKHGFGPFAPEIYRVPVAYPYRWLTGPENCAEEAAAQAVDLIGKQVGADNVAAIVIEPILGEGGFIVPAPGFLPRIAQFAKDNGIVFVADEIQSGFCRTGRWFACEEEGVVPDLITTAKGIAGGLPLAAVTGRAEIMDAPHVGGLGGTYGGNPVACAAALGAIETMRELDLNARARRIEEIMKSRLTALKEKHDAIGEVRGRGAMLAIELVKPGTKDPDPQLTATLAKACHAEGLLVLTTGTYGNVMRFLPPLVIGEELLAEGLDILEGVLSRNA
jgi:4-aminobutyrate aminotransferase/(S)-3-amino-2-methylpropionate transaminase